jgi:hypothetical protein
MDAVLAMLGMLVVRVILPISVLLAFGEWAARQEHRNFNAR